MLKVVLFVSKFIQFLINPRSSIVVCQTPGCELPPPPWTWSRFPRDVGRRGMPINLPLLKNLPNLSTRIGSLVTCHIPSFIEKNVRTWP